MNTPFLGCAYYPEDWPEDQMDSDIAKMKEAGIKCARIGEFAWRKMEPVRGGFDFSWLHTVVDKLAAAEIAVVMGTPTATPPIWLIREYPDVAVLDENGIRNSHGGRRHCCSVNPHYIEACDAIVEAMGREFGEDPAIIGWQLDNEIYTWDKGCTCSFCMDWFHKKLAEEYHTVGELNERWNLNLFSQAYDSFDEIPAPVHGWHNPHIGMEWTKAHQEGNIAFIHRQAEILRKYTKAPIGTDMMPFNSLDHEKMTEPLDIVQFNHYNTWDTIDSAIFWFDHLRTLKDRPFWNTETAPTWNGSVACGMKIQPEGFCRTNSWLPVALGGEANMYWLWREHWAGHELMHGSVLSPEGRPTHTFGEIRRTADEFAAASDFLTGTKVSTDTAILFTSRCWNLFMEQPVVQTDDEVVAGTNYQTRVRRFHSALMNIGVRPDVIAAGHDLTPYKVILTPYTMTLEDHDLTARLPEWVKDGGTWIVGPLADIRNSIGAHYRDRGYGILEELLGIRLDYTVPVEGSEVTVADRNGRTIPVTSVLECTSGAAEPLASITAGHSALVGKTVIGSVPFGKGRVILCGTQPEAKALEKLLASVLDDAGAKRFEISGKVQVIPRCGEAGRGLILAGTGNEEASVTLPVPMTDVLTGRIVSAGRLNLAPWEIRVLKA